MGYKTASNLGKLIGEIIGPKFRSKKTITENIRNFKPSINNDEVNVLIKKMWGNYGRILAEYPFIPNFRNKKLEKHLKIEGLNSLKKS